MKPVIYFIIICVVGYFVWQYTTQPNQPRIVKPPVLTQPPPLPSGKAVNDQYKSLIVRAEIYNDVTVRMVFPDSIAIIHRDGAITIPLADVPKEIQSKYSYDPTYAAEYISLKAAHAQYKKNKAKEAEKKREEKTSGEEKPAETPKPSLLSQIQQAIPALPAAPTPSPSVSPTPTPPPTPEEQLQAMIGGTPVEATKLATLCEQYPSQANLILKGRKIKVTGTIKQLWVRGIQCADMDIDLFGTPKYRVEFSTDWMRYNTAHTGSMHFDFKLVKSGKMLMKYSNGGSYSTLDHVVHTEGEKVSLEGLIENIGPSSIKIHYAGAF